MEYDIGWNDTQGTLFMDTSSPRNVVLERGGESNGSIHDWPTPSPMEVSSGYSEQSPGNGSQESPPRHPASGVAKDNDSNPHDLGWYYTDQGTPIVVDSSPDGGAEEHGGGPGKEMWDFLPNHGKKRSEEGVPGNPESNVNGPAAHGPVLELFEGLF